MIRYLLFRNVPLNIIRGARRGEEIAMAALTDGDAADISEPNAVVALATRTTVPQQTRNLYGSLFKLHIQ